MPTNSGKPYREKMILFCLPLMLTAGCVNHDEKPSGQLPELTLEEYSFAAPPAKEWSRAVPENARQISFAWGRAGEALDPVLNRHSGVSPLTGIVKEEKSMKKSYPANSKAGRRGKRGKAN